MRAELSITDLAQSAASFVFDYDNHFGFEGNTGAMFLEGPMFGDETRKLGPSVVKEGETFTFEFERRSESLVFSINDRVVYSFKGHAERMGPVSFRPWRSKMRIRSLTIEGTTYEEAPLPALTDVFVSGTEGYNTFRIPSIILAPNGTLLAFAEGGAPTRATRATSTS